MKIYYSLARILNYIAVLALVVFFFYSVFSIEGVGNLGEKCSDEGLSCLLGIVLEKELLSLLIYFFLFGLYLFPLIFLNSTLRNIEKDIYETNKRVSLYVLFFYIFFIAFALRILSEFFEFGILSAFIPYIFLVCFAIMTVLAWIVILKQPQEQFPKLSY